MARSAARQGRDYGGAMDRTTRLSSEPASPIRATNTVSRIVKRGLSFTDGDTRLTCETAATLQRSCRRTGFSEIKASMTRWQRTVHDKAAVVARYLWHLTVLSPSPAQNNIGLIISRNIWGRYYLSLVTKQFNFILSTWGNIMLISIINTLIIY